VVVGQNGQDHLWPDCANSQDLSSGYDDLDLLLVHYGMHFQELLEKLNSREWWWKAWDSQIHLQILEI